LKERVKEFVISLLKNYSQPLKEFIRNLISIELAFINTNHPDFFGGGQTAFMLLEKMKSGGQQQQQMQQVQQPQPQQQLPKAPVAQGKQLPQQPQQQVSVSLKACCVFMCIYILLFYCCVFQTPSRVLRTCALVTYCTSLSPL